ncbi:MAG: hypothetical protein NT077_00220 [Candidatus Taylorbacteria bacterium]|nr:hypothetical protein [Candidatus Taylorbacteria bacterium]
MSIGLNPVNNSTTNGGYYNRGIDLILYNKIASGVTNSGNIMGIQNSVYRNHVYAGDTGTLDSMYGYYSEYGHISKDSSAPATTNMYGMYLYPNARSGLVTNMYDLYINSVNTIGRTDTLTNHWSIYQADTTSKNYLAGKTGVGSTTPWGLLSVNPTALGSGVPEFVVGSSTATHFVVNGAGNVGIGTSNPGARLDIQSLNGASGSLILSEAGRGAKLVGEGDGAGAGAFSIQTLIGSTYTEKFRILSTGNVGIGTAAPLSNLQVNGGSNLPGTLTISTASVQGAVVGNIDFYNSISPAATTTRISAITRSDDSRYSALTFNGKIYPSATMSVSGRLRLLLLSLLNKPAQRFLLWYPIKAPQHHS